MTTINGVVTEKTELERLREAKAARVEARKKEAEARELEELQLEEKHEAATGRRGLDFEIVSTEIGCFVIGKPSFVVAKAFNSIPADKRGDEDVVRFASALVLHPDPMQARKAFTDHGGIAWRCANAALALYEARSVEHQGKF